MNRKEVGQVTEEEKKVIQTLFERRNGLNELAKIITPDNDILYERLVKDLGESVSQFQQWWDEASAKYAWEAEEGASWEIDFTTNKVYLVKR